MAIVNKDTLYYTKIDYSNLPELTYQIIKYSDDTEQVLDTGIVYHELRAPALEKIGENVYYLKENVNVDNNSYSIELKESKNKVIWKYEGSLDNYLTNSTGQNVNNPYIRCSDNLLSFVTNDRSGGYLYYSNGENIKKVNLKGLVHDAVPTKDYIIIDCENEDKVLDMKTGTLTPIDQSVSLARFYYMEDNIFLSMNNDLPTINIVEQGKVEQIPISEISPQTDIDFVKTAENEYQITVYRYNENNADRTEICILNTK